MHSPQGPEVESMKGKQAIETEKHLSERGPAHSTMSAGPAAVDTAAIPHELEVSTFLGSAPMPEEQSLLPFGKMHDFRVQLGAEEEKTDPALETKRLSLPSAGTPKAALKRKRRRVGTSSSTDEDSPFEEPPVPMHNMATSKKPGINFESLRFFNATRRLRKGKARQRTVDSQMKRTATNNATDSKALMDSPVPALPDTDMLSMSDGHVTEPSRHGHIHEVVTRHGSGPGDESFSLDHSNARRDTVDQQSLQSSAEASSEPGVEKQQMNSCIRSF